MKSLRLAVALGAVAVLSAGCSLATIRADLFGPSASAASTAAPATTVVTQTSETAPIAGAQSAPAVQATVTPPPATQAQKIIFDLRAGYDTVFLAPASEYAQEPLCGSSGAPSAPLCSDANLVASLRSADRDAKAALDAAEDQARNHPTMSADSAIALAKNAIAAAELILTNHNIH